MKAEWKSVSTTPTVPFVMISLTLLMQQLYVHSMDFLNLVSKFVVSIPGPRELLNMIVYDLNCLGMVLLGRWQFSFCPTH